MIPSGYMFAGLCAATLGSLAFERLSFIDQTPCRHRVPFVDWKKYRL